ncbi:MAG: hypothetical protein AAF748_05540 [Pseudomonadota bacterium]
MNLRCLLVAPAVVAFQTAAPAQAADYRCGEWTTQAEGTNEIVSLSVLKQMIVFSTGGANLTARMFYGTLDQTTYLNDGSAIILYGDRVKNSEGQLVFGDTILVQRLYYDPQSPRLTRAKCDIEP